MSVEDMDRIQKRKKLSSITADEPIDPVAYVG